MIIFYVFYWSLIKYFRSGNFDLIHNVSGEASYEFVNIHSLVHIANVTLEFATP